MKETLKPTINLTAVKKTITKGNEKFSAWVLDTSKLPESTLEAGAKNDKS